ncbi:MAG: 1-(5-phosphoribosyl)-5-[(5-phosphoribosylamino)methylideneamino]imidazole-4-carboxamide isomerase [Promethearchaeota archaeon]
MTMEIIPAIDIQDGKCVRLTKGLLEKKTVYYEDPLDALHYWEEQGATRLHIVDLDGAFGIGTNYKLIKRIVNSTSIGIQVGGGIRTIEKAKKLIELGVERVIIGTAAVKNPNIVSRLEKEIGRDKIIVALDQKKGKLVIKGWTEAVEYDLFEFAKLIESKGAGGILISSVEGDGAFTGPDLETTKKMVASVNIPIIAAGGVRNTEDIRNLYEINVNAVIIGKAFYEGRLGFKECMNLLKDLDRRRVRA